MYHPLWERNFYSGGIKGIFALFIKVKINGPIILRFWIRPVNVEDYYFYEKEEPIYITVSINPQKELDTNIDSETLAAIPLDCITKY